jgi:hypothetical protein
MAEVILMPRLSDTMTEGVIAAWHKKVGDKVKKATYWLRWKPTRPPWNWKVIKMAPCFT